MAKCPKKMFSITMRISFITLLLLMGVGEIHAGIGDKVSSIIRSVPGVFERKSLAFFSHFGANLNRNKKDGRLECDYDDPAKIHMCPPIPPSPFPPPPSTPVKEKGAPSNDLPSRKKGGAADDRKTASIPADLIAKCLENPDDPDCVRLEEEKSEGGDALAPVQAPASAPAAFLGGRFLETQFPANVVQTEAPTKNDCYGQMIDPRFCKSSMPSVSLEPTKATDDGLCENQVRKNNSALL